MSTHLDNFNEGDRLSAGKLQSAVRGIRSLQRQAEPLADEPTPLRFMAQTWPKGPADEVDYKDERYWIQAIYSKAADYDANLKLDIDPIILTPRTIVTASNLCEWNAFTHFLPEHTLIEVYCIADYGSPSKFHYVFNAQMQSVRVKITGNHTGGGKYQGYILRAPTADLDLTSNLAAADLGSGAANADSPVTIVNTAEMGQATHDLTSGTPKTTVFPGTIIRTQADGRVIVSITATDWENCS